MAGHLLALSIGPVQEFISAARRTRDLWFGSFLLSELSKAAAKAIADASSLETLIFPAPEKPEELEPTPERDDPKLTVANVVVARLPDGTSPEEFAATAREAVQQRWREFAGQARKEAGKLVRDELWNLQLDDVIEFYAAWAPLDGSYLAARKRLMRLLDARKRCRDFAQPLGDPAKRRLPKSSLDGRRETVLADPDRAGSGLRARLRLQEGEQLDVVGVTKRLAHGRRPFVSVARVAADPWLRGVAGRAKNDREVAAALEALKEQCKRLGGDVIGKIDEGKFPIYAAFPYDGTAVYRNRYDDLAQEAGIERKDLAPLERALDRLTKPLRSGGLGFGDPYPYVALLVADGDRMGKLISALDSPERHREFSRQLAGFAKEAAGIVREHNGVCIYAGGDDVLALVPLDKCLECARRLRDKFCELLRPFGDTTDPPTFSAGLAIGHFMDPLEDLRNYAREAEKAAKSATPETDGSGLHAERNALAVFVHPRGGAPFGIREQWLDSDASIERRLARWAGLFRKGSLPNKLPYDVRQLARHYASWRTAGTLPAAIAAGLDRLLEQKETRLKNADKTWVFDRLAAARSAGDLHRLANEMLVAQHIGEAVQQADPAGRAAGSAKEVSS